MKRYLKIYTLFILCACAMNAQAQRSVERLSEGWKFHLGHAASVKDDFGNGTEYFNYLTKAHSIHNEGPYVMKYDDSQWETVRIPHDWALQLPYAPEASHSHGYRAVGWKYPQNSVGWYRKVIDVPAEDAAKHIELQFDGIFRNAQVWVNGFYMGQEPSGYITQTYDISDYLEYGAKNLICVRADASLEEGWFYEGAGIYRDVWLKKTGNVHVKTDGTFVYAEFKDGDLKTPTLRISVEVENTATEKVEGMEVRNTLYDAEGNKLSEFTNKDNTGAALLAKATYVAKGNMKVSEAHLWDIDDPYLYSLKSEVVVKGQVVDTYTTTFGIRDAHFTADKGFMLNGRQVKLKGVNCHQDHAGVGAAIPDALQEWRIKQLKAMGCNAYRASHNPMTPALLDICDREGILVIDENRLMGINDYHLRQLEKMIKRDRNHPSIILWSDGNEEWGLENNSQGVRLAASMREYTHRLDPSREVTIANAGGVEMIKSLEVVGYNYIVQNDVMNRHKAHPDWKIAGTEETTACGTRGVYYPDPQGRWMPSINRTDTTYENIIERGWKFYADNEWASGLFYWTGFDYRGEPNPLGYPSVGSEFGLLDYCGFPKDEAYYLKAWWTDETILHIFPHWNLQGHEGETVSVWAYSNCDEVELFVNGKSVGRQTMPKNGHLKWDATYMPGNLRAVGYKGGKKVKEEKIVTTGAMESIKATYDIINGLAIVNISLCDKKGNVVPTACDDLEFTLDGDGYILGAGNGDPAFKGEEHPKSLSCKSFAIPAFNGHAQVLVQLKDDNVPSTLILKSGSVITKVKMANDGLRMKRSSISN